MTSADDAGGCVMIGLHRLAADDRGGPVSEFQILLSLRDEPRTVSNVTCFPVKARTARPHGAEAFPGANAAGATNVVALASRTGETWVRFRNYRKV